jgi:hypothetical protein
MDSISMLRPVDAFFTNGIKKPGTVIEKLGNGLVYRHPHTPRVFVNEQGTVSELSTNKNNQLVMDTFTPQQTIQRAIHIMPKVPGSVEAAETVLQTFNPLGQPVEVAVVEPKELIHRLID